MIRLIDAEKVYDNGTHALKGVSFTVDDGEFVFLVGPSGSGKSTIIKLLTGEVVPTAGRVMVNGFSMSRISERQIPYMRRTIGVIFQDFRLIGNKTVYDNLALAMRAVGAPPRELRSRIPYVLELVGLADIADRHDRHNDHDLLKQRNCNFGRLLPFGSAVDNSSLVICRVNACYRREVNDHAITGCLPDIHQNNDERPPSKRLLTIPVDTLAAHRLNHIVDKTFVTA